MRFLNLSNISNRIVKNSRKFWEVLDPVCEILLFIISAFKGIPTPASIVLDGIGIVCSTFKNGSIFTEFIITKFKKEEKTSQKEKPYKNDPNYIRLQYFRKYIKRPIIIFDFMGDFGCFGISIAMAIAFFTLGSMFALFPASIPVALAIVALSLACIKLWTVRVERRLKTKKNEIKPKEGDDKDTIETTNITCLRNLKAAVSRVDEKVMDKLTPSTKKIDRLFGFFSKKYRSNLEKQYTHQGNLNRCS